MPIIGTDRAFPKQGGADGINIRTYVATEILVAMIASQSNFILANPNKEALIDSVILAAWARADQFLLGG
jgi:hypothetical protein